ncbi:hypothetical protein N7478_007673 [Penicillium angulare]|uniref:uncharacterized protein n=1 Tax=Penicillium angulare TaxID=116970 RepID=UPI002541F53F|nr:uncharacterized protein N7478_007673 [Penicillium angulare]KAJ5272548.1 hypothetical protein N7478_007673 [Penicillium angulare]
MADPPLSPGTSPRNSSSTPALRRRGLGLPARTTLEAIPDWPERRNSTLSDSISEARHSIRSSTDDLFLPRVARHDDGPIATEESHWHSAPLGLALLPAIAGVLFKNGSAFVTDVTILVLAAIFLNWSVRLPWDWYRAAQASHPERSGYEHTNEPSETISAPDEAIESGDESQSQPHPQTQRRAPNEAALKELQIHELAALASCFIFPVIGTWLLHGIRHSLSRPSEGLVSNYNLTIFLLASEIRPFAHLLRLVQARTLHLQRIVASSPDEPRQTLSKVQDLTKRLEELEAHVAETASRYTKSKSPLPDGSQHEDAPSLLTQSVVEARRALTPDIEALNRAVRRYEKRTALTTLQSDTRFQQLEAQTRDAIALAAAAQRSSLSRRPSYAFILLDWACACVVVPAQLGLSVLNLPSRVATSCFTAARKMVGLHREGVRNTQPRSKSSKGKMAQTASSKFQRQSSGPMSFAQQPSVQGTDVKGAPAR